MLVVGCTCPYQSWQNVAERVMCTLNLALMNVSLARKELPDVLESLLRNKKTMDDVRQVIATNPAVGESLQDAMQNVICTLSTRLTSMEIKGERIQVEMAPGETELTQCFEWIHFIEPGLPQENIKKKTLMENEHLCNFMQLYESSLQLYCLPLSGEEMLRSGMLLLYRTSC